MGSPGRIQITGPSVGTEDGKSCLLSVPLLIIFLWPFPFLIVCFNLFYNFPHLVLMESQGLTLKSTVPQLVVKDTSIKKAESVPSSSRV